MDIVALRCACVKSLSGEGSADFSRRWNPLSRPEGINNFFEFRHSLNAEARELEERIAYNMRKPSSGDATAEGCKD
jgi:hypothetical protein